MPLSLEVETLPRLPVERHDHNRLSGNLRFRCRGDRLGIDGGVRHGTHRRRPLKYGWNRTGRHRTYRNYGNSTGRCGIY